MRDDDDLDDDEYHPRKSRERERGPFPTGIVIALVVVAVVLVVAGLFLVGRSRQATEQAHRAMEENQMQLARALEEHQKPPMVVEKPRSNWEKVIGTWTRAAPPGDTALPVRFEFSRDMSAQVTHLLPDGGTQSRRCQVDLIVDEGDQLAVRFRDGDVLFTFQFTLSSDRTIVMRNGAGRVAYSRQ